ncbi:MAG: DUF484 family protein [Gammaproteobacteria bacterium]|nr:MAG: DUF484 family protein [Gammaproteobacteria bacterium]UCH41160.1 MAG: DUF484 family protein [Gammaproteobacteria bacterium]
MSEVSAEQRQNDPVDEAGVIQYLRNNPEVLLKYPDIFCELAIPHQTGAATSLVERQLKLLREENQSLKAKIEELVGIARENEELNQRFHRLALELMNTDQLHDVLAMVQDQVQTFFYTDFVCFRFLPNVSAESNILDGLYLDQKSGIVDSVKPWIEARKPVCGRQDEKINRELFGADIRIGSSALIPLYHTGDLGLLCLGSVSADRFGLTMGTIFLQQLGELVSNRLKNLLQVA